MIGVEAHVLRFWEKEFTQIKPQRSNGRRYYSNQTIEIITTIKDLLHTQGYTLQGAKNYLKHPTEKTQTNDTVDLSEILNKLKEIQTILQ